MKTKQAVNPYLPSWEYVPDAEPHIVDGRVYIYGSHDLFNGLNFCLGDYVCWSAPVDDLGNWRYEGVIFKREQDPAHIPSLADTDLQPAFFSYLHPPSIILHDS